MPKTPPKLESKWHNFLSEIDQRLAGPAQIICIGGFVVTEVHGFSRDTGDLDHIQSPCELIEELQAIAGEGSALHKKHKIFVHYVGIVTMPYDFEERLTAGPFQFNNLKIMIPEVYDLVLSKLERNSPKDYADVQYLAQKYRLSFATLRKRFDEELDFIANRERHIQTLDVFWRDWFHD